MKKFSIGIYLVGVFFMMLLMAAFNGKDAHGTYVDIATQNSNYCVCTTFDTIYFNNNIPPDSGVIPNQTLANCFAWKEFIALNWPSDGSNNFGDPSYDGLVQWETYMQKEVLMPANGQAPPPWGSSNALLKKGEEQKRLLFHASKFTNFSDTIEISETGQAFPNSRPNWLGASNNSNVWYEVLVNKDEYDYITDPSHQFYNADKQLSWVQAGNQIVLPKGSLATGEIGAMELKAAWMELPNPTATQKARYKISEAVLVDPISGKMRNTTVGLIGLHIIHKTESQPTWIWATFEHVDNAPDLDATPSGNYNLYSTSCSSKTMQIPAKFSETGKDTTVVINCDSINQSPPYYLGKGGPNPTQLQVKRVTSLDNNSVQVNQTVQQAIQQYYPNSVYQYYQLVDVIWSSNPVQDKNQPSSIPLKLAALNPSNNVANSSMETYFQTSKCTDCHQFGSIAGSSNYASDFSFVLSAASSATND